MSSILNISILLFTVAFVNSLTKGKDAKIRNFLMKDLTSLLTKRSESQVQSTNIQPATYSQLQNSVDEFLKQLDNTPQFSTSPSTICLGNLLQAWNKCLETCNGLLISKNDGKENFDHELRHKLKKHCRNQYCPVVASSYYVECAKRFKIENGEEASRLYFGF